MKLFDGVGREHEEFKLRLNKEKEIELAAIQVEEEIAASQALVVSEALKSANIDIVGGDIDFFDKIVNSVSNAKAIDRLVNNSSVLADVKETFFNGDSEYFQGQLEKFIGQFGVDSGDVKNLSVAALIAKMMGMTDSDGIRNELQQLLESVRKANLSETMVSSLGIGTTTAGKR